MKLLYCLLYSVLAPQSVLTPPVRDAPDDPGFREDSKVLFPYKRAESREPCRFELEWHHPLEQMKRDRHNGAQRKRFNGEKPGAFLISGKTWSLLLTVEDALRKLVLYCTSTRPQIAMSISRDCIMCFASTE